MKMKEHKRIKQYTFKAFKESRKNDFLYYAPAISNDEVAQHTLEASGHSTIINFTHALPDDNRLSIDKKTLFIMMAKSSYDILVEKAAKERSEIEKPIHVKIDLLYKEE